MSSQYVVDEPCQAGYRKKSFALQGQLDVERQLQAAFAHVTGKRIGDEKDVLDTAALLSLMFHAHQT